MLKERLFLIVGSIVFRMMLPLTDNTDCPRVVCLKGTLQSPLEVALLVDPLLVLGLIYSVSAGGASPLRVL